LANDLITITATGKKIDKKTLLLAIEGMGAQLNANLKQECCVNIIGLKRATTDEQITIIVTTAGNATNYTLKEFLTKNRN